jgi:hypothetical protein
MATATLLLPARDRFAGQALPLPLAHVLGRADAIAASEAGARAQLLRHFALLPRGWPVAALTRSQDASDAASAQWLRADPAWIRPDINGARLFACGDGLPLSGEDAGALLPSLRTLFGDTGFPIDAPSPSRWYLRMPVGATLPPFPEPDEALGTDLGDALVDAGGGSAGADVRRWRALLNEAQVVLHNHPWNARRAAAGKPPVNSLWFWGGGMLPDNVTTTHSQVASDDVLLRALAANAGVSPAPASVRFELAGDGLFDLREARDLAALDRDWLQPATGALRHGKLRELRLDFADGAGYLLVPAQRWRFWRRPLARLAGVPRDDPET